MPRPLISRAKTAMAVAVAVFGIFPGFNHADAGDIAQRDIIGFSASGGHFACEEYAVQVHKDAAIPQSRGCPLDYRIAGIFTFYPESGTPVFAALIGIIAVGFEGPDVRFMAVTGALPG